jgi:nucleotidyltransferase/DNA polymerase involved in DNA repair
MVANAIEEAWGGHARRCPSLPAFARLGWGRGKFTAWVAATRAAPGQAVIVSDSDRLSFLASQPLAVLPLHPDHHRRLRRLGLTTLGDLVRLPQEAVVSQFGREGRQAWRLAAGMLTEQVSGRENPEPITAAIDFPLPIADRPMLVYALERLIAKALAHPRRTGWRIHALRARAGLEHGTSWMTEVTYKDPSADVARLLAPLQVRLEQTPPQGAVEHLAVEFTAFVPGTSELQLFARDAASAARAGRQRALRSAAGEIRTRFKRTMLARVVEVEPASRIPERRYALVNYEP